MLLADTDKNAAAVSEALDELAQNGFVRGEDGEWSGHLRLDPTRFVASRVALPPDFPHTMPIVRVEVASLPRRIPHVEANGKVCIAPASGVLLDTGNPRGIIRDSLARAHQVVQEGIAGSNDRDFIIEFSAYWNAPGQSGLLFVADPTGTARPMVVARPDTALSQQEVLAENLNAATNWLGLIGRKVSSHRGVLFVPLTRPFCPPKAGDEMTVAEILSRLQLCASPCDYAVLLDYLKRNRLPITIAFSLPVGQRHGFAIAAFQLEEAYKAGKLYTLRVKGGTRRSTLWELWCAREQPITRLRVERADPAFTLARGGGAGLLGKSVVIVGCGSVGSRIAEHLASMGVGEITLIDPERHLPENVHRHLLGMSHVGSPKATGVADVLKRRFPHLRFQHHEQTVEQVLAAEPQTLRNVDVVVMASGDETLELRLNDLLSLFPAVRVHTWLEPLGLGGHVLACGGHGGRGCYRCLFGWDERLRNAASFAAPEQQFQRTHAGCSGSFTPYASLDADRTAIEAARAVVEILSGWRNAGFLISWFGDPTAFNEAGFRLSSRAAMFAPGDCRLDLGFAHIDCTCCGGHLG